VQTRRLIAAAVVVVVVIVMALLIHGCEVSQTNSSLKNYSADVDSLITASDNNGSAMFTDLESGSLNSSTVGALQNKLNIASENARKQLARAESYSPPGAMSDAQSALVRVMQLREQGISQIAKHIQASANKNTSKDGVYDISLGTAQLFSSDVFYKTFVATDIAKVLNATGIPIGGTTGAQINPGQIVTDLGWLQSTFISEKIGAQLSTSAANANNNAPGLHGHSLNYVSVGTTQLSTAVTNTIPASPAPTFTLNVTNGGNFNEYDVGCQVSIANLSDTGTSTIRETFRGQTTNCSVTLPSPPTPGTYQVTARVLKVPRETHLSNNVLTYTIDFN
jgi:hypothetical protein